MTRLGRLPRRLTAGIVLLLGLALPILVGPFVLGPPPPADAVRAALVPPGTVLTVVDLTDGGHLVSPAVENTPAGLRVGGGPRPEAVAASRIVRTAAHRAWFGTDRYGRDLLHLMLTGGRLSLAIAGFGTLIALGVGLAVGMGAASAGRVVDTVLMRIVDAVLAFPALLLLILCAAVLEPGPLTLVGLLGLTSWMGLARLVRGQVLSIRERPFVLAARVSQTPWYRMWTWHFLPEIRGPLAQDVALRMGDLVLAEATLSYLGLGLPPTTPTWGQLVSEGHRVMLDAWWLATIPGIAIALLVMAFALIGDGIQDL